MTCVALATGLAKHVLRGKYVDVGQDLEDILAQAEAIKRDENLYSLHTTFLGGLGNGVAGGGDRDVGLKEGGHDVEGDGEGKEMERREESFKFPGF